MRTFPRARVDQGQPVAAAGKRSRDFGAQRSGRARHERNVGHGGHHV